MTVIPLSEALASVAVELETLRDFSGDLQDVVSDLVSAGPPPAPDAINALQRLDRMTQELSDLAPFIAEMAAYAADHGHPDVSTATETVRLDSLRARLQGVVGGGSKVTPGEPELF